MKPGVKGELDAIVFPVAWLLEWEISKQMSEAEGVKFKWVYHVCILAKINNINFVSVTGQDEVNIVECRRGTSQV